MESHETDLYAHAPILIDLHAQITDLQKLGWMVRGGLLTLGAIVGGSVLVIVLHIARVI